MFEPTIPFGEPELIRVSAFQRYLDDLAGCGSTMPPRPSMLSSSLLADLRHLNQGGYKTEVLEVLAACVRHAQDALIHLQIGDKVLPLTIFVHERLAHCPMELDAFLALPLEELGVLHVEPAMLRPLGDREVALVADPAHYHALGPLTWELALRLRDELLPEIAGPAAYRVTPGLDLHGLTVSEEQEVAIERLRLRTTSLRYIVKWPGLTRETAVRLLNALYLQAGLMVSRSHPDAVAETWLGALSR